MIMIIFLAILAVLLLLAICNKQESASGPYKVTIIAIVLVYLIDKVIQYLS